MASQTTIQIIRFKWSGKFYEEITIDIPDELEQWQREIFVRQQWIDRDDEMHWYASFQEYDNGVPRLYVIGSK